MHRKSQQLKNPEAGMRKDGVIAGRGTRGAGDCSAACMTDGCGLPATRRRLSACESARKAGPASANGSPAPPARHGNSFFVENAVCLIDAVPAQCVTRLDTTAR
jgi:hypothetical protein